MITVPQAIRFLVQAFSNSSDRTMRELHAALAQLGNAVAWQERLEHLSAQVLLAGFEILAESSRDNRHLLKLRLIRDNLRLLLSEEEPALIHAPAIIALWADIISLASYTALRTHSPLERRRWMATAQAWAGGLQAIFFRSLPREGREARDSA